MRFAMHVHGVFWLIGAQLALGQELPTLTVAELSERVAEAESRIQDLDVLMTLTSQEFGGVPGAPPDASYPAPGIYVNTIRWVFRAPFGTRFRLEADGARAWFGGARDVAYLRGVVTFDGVDSWRLSRFALVADDIETAPTLGAVLPGKDPGVAGGDGYAQMTFWRHGRALSEVMQSIPGSTVELDALDEVGAVYRVALPWNGKDDPEGSIGPEILFCDPSRAFALVRVEEPSPDPTIVNSLLRVHQLVLAAPDVWIPIEGTLERFGNATLLASNHWQVHNVAANTNPGDELFSVNFPAGSMVSDLRTNISFRVGFNAEGADEAMGAQADAAQAAVDQLSAGQRVELPVLAMERVDMAPSPVETTPEPLPRWLITTGLLVGLAMSCVTGLAGIRVRRTRPMLARGLAAIGAAGLVLAGASTYGLAARVAPPSPLPLALLPAPPASSQPVFDCGRSVLGVLAKYHGTGWSAQDIVSHTGTAPGMSLLQIRDTARAMGLTAEGVRVTTTGELRKFLRQRGSTLVLATSLAQEDRQIGHFICTVGAATEHFVVIDPPRPVHLMKLEHMAEAMASGKGYAVVVQPKG